MQMVVNEIYDAFNLMRVLFAFPFQRVRSSQLKLSRSGSFVEIIPIASERIAANERNVAW